MIIQLDPGVDIEDVLMCCRYFVGCDSPTSLVTRHPILGLVATCPRCAKRFDLVLTPVTDLVTSGELTVQVAS